MLIVAGLLLLVIALDNGDVEIGLLLLLLLPLLLSKELLW